MDKFLGCNVVFGAYSDALAFPGTAKEMPVVDADPYLNKLLVKYCERPVCIGKAGAARSGSAWRTRLLRFCRTERCAWTKLPAGLA